MSERDHHHQHHNYSQQQQRSSSNNPRDSPSSRRPAAAAGSNSHTYNGGSSTNSKSEMPAATMRNTNVTPSGSMASLSDDLSHLNLTSEVTVGSTVQCCIGPTGRILKGEVLAFDTKLKAMILKCPSSCNRGSLNDVHILNLSQMKELKILSENSSSVPDPPSLNIHKLQNRLKEQVDRKRRLVMAFKAGVSPEGQKLFQTIGKTIDDIVWNGENIVVMREVTITPPYRPENVKSHADSKALKHIRKIVEKHINDQALLAKHQQQQPEASRPASDMTSHNNNNNNNVKSDASTPTSTSPALPGGGSSGARTSSPAAAVVQHHQSATRTGSAGRYGEDSSGGGGGGKNSGRQQQQRSTGGGGGGGRSSGSKRDFDSKSISRQVQVCGKRN